MILKSKISQRSYPPESTSINQLENEPMNQERMEESELPMMSNSCISPSDDGVESAKEKDERTILNEPMVAKALELFSPKKVRVKRKN